MMQVHKFATDRLDNTCDKRVPVLESHSRLVASCWQPSRPRLRPVA